MSLQNKIVIFLLALIFLFLTIQKIRFNVLRPFYSVLWLAFGGFLLFVSLGSRELKWFSDKLFAFNDARHFVYIIAFGFIFVYALHATFVINKMQDEIRILISEVGILRIQKSFKKTDSPSLEKKV